MKKLLLILFFIFCLLFFTFVLVGCDVQNTQLVDTNFQLVDTNYRFEYVHIYETGKCYEIESWRDYGNSAQIQVTLKDGTVLLLHTTDCALVHGDGCVFCKDKSK